MEVRIVFPNASLIAKEIAVAGRAGAVAAAEALRHEGQEVLARSIDEVPVDTGALKASGRLLPQQGGVIQTGNTMEVQIAFGSTAADYAVYVHENLEAHHPHGKAKYVEGPMLRQVVGISQRIADKVRATQKGIIK